jgi:hypothetical protein
MRALLTPSRKIQGFNLRCPHQLTLNRAKIDGYYYTVYNDNPYFEKGYGLYNPLTKKRKRGFYMYKSYQRVP